MLDLRSIKKIKGPELWKYTKDWLNKKFGDWVDDDKDKIAKALKSEVSSRFIRSYICQEGPAMVANKRHINRFIDMIKDGEFSNQLDLDHMEQFIDRFKSLPDQSAFEDFEKNDDKLYAINYTKAPSEIVKIVNIQKNISIEVKNTFKEILKNLEEAYDNNKTKEEESYFERQNFQKNQFNNLTKWDRVELKHSKLKDGIVYILTNELMPGLIKIGFTAGSPENRARQIAEKHSLPSPFMVAGYFRTKDPYIVEQNVHSELSDLKVSGEFFKIDVTKAMEIINKHIITY